MNQMKGQDNEQQIAELETQLAFQEDHLQKLNDALINTKSVWLKLKMVLAVRSRSL